MVILIHSLTFSIEVLKTEKDTEIAIKSIKLEIIGNKIKIELDM